MHFISLPKSLMTILLVFSTLLLRINGARQLSRRARSRVNPANGQYESWAVGPPNPAVSCDLGLYGRPLLRDCLNLGGPIMANLGRTLQQTQVVREFFNEGTIPRFQNLDPTVEIKLPYWWRVGSCVVTINLVGPAAFSQTSDRATGGDVVTITGGITMACVNSHGRGVGGGPSSGGSQIFGEENGLLLRLFSTESLWFERLDTESECSDTPEVVASGLNCQQRAGRRPRPDYGSSDDDGDGGQGPAQRRRVCSSLGAVDHYSEDQTCCGWKNYKWISLTVREALGELLFGIGKVVEQAMGFCGEDTPVVS